MINKKGRTKRQILSMVARLYDPMGFISPCIMYAKLIMKSLWLSKKGWDDEVDTEIMNKFTSFITQLSKLESIRIERWIQTKDDISQSGCLFEATKILKLILLTSKTYLEQFCWQIYYNGGKINSSAIPTFRHTLILRLS